MRALFPALALALAGLATAAHAGAEPAGRVLSRLMVDDPSSADLMRNGMAAFQANDYAAARVHFRQLAARGDPSAETLLGTMAANGQGAPRDYAIAAAWFLRASRRGYAPAQMALADCFARGRGVPRNIARARTLAQAAAAQGQPGAAELAIRVLSDNYALMRDER